MLLLSTMLHCAALRADIELDGQITEEIWSSAQVFTDFLVSQPRSFAKPPRQTRALVLSTGDGIYIAFVCEQPGAERIDLSSLDDETPNTDYIEVVVDFDAQGSRAFGFKLSRLGTIQDSVWQDENLELSEWDGDWGYGVSADSGEWRAEMFIPWTTTPMAARGDKVIGLYLSRWDNFNQQRYSYPALDKTQTQFLSQLPEVRVAAPATKAIDFYPYVSMNGDLLHQRTSYKAGLDVFWKWDNSSQLNLTINPDFGQVESDELVVNFSAIEAFFSEKRPFFRENHDLFDLRGPESLRLVHTPRIGGKLDSGSRDSASIDAATRIVSVYQHVEFGALIAQEEDVGTHDGRLYAAARLLGHLGNL
jgi:hypothetical protein